STPLRLHSSSTPRLSFFSFKFHCPLNHLCNQFLCSPIKGLLTQSQKHIGKSFPHNLNLWLTLLLQNQALLLPLR
ncbi:hypothetical protein FRX31_003985, partial [Thalictrum thalictroides]